jgi:hypothetical protein
MFIPDRDPGGFDLPPKEVQRRRGLWWNLYGQDSWNVSNRLSHQSCWLTIQQSMGFSLPPALSTKHFDTKWPDFGHDVGANLCMSFFISREVFPLRDGA